MNDSGGAVNGRTGRLVRLGLECREVSAEPAETVCYSGVLLTAYEDGCPVGEIWLPLGPEPTEADDELLINHLHAAFLWQYGLG